MKRKDDIPDLRAVMSLTRVQGVGINWWRVRLCCGHRYRTKWAPEDVDARPQVCFICRRKRKRQECKAAK